MTRVLIVPSSTRSPADAAALAEPLHSRLPGWKVEFCARHDQLASCLGEEDFDIVVVDVGQGDVSGVELLQSVEEAGPRILRIAVVGIADHELSLRAAEHAHQVHCRPGDPDLLASSLKRGRALREVLDDDRLCGLLGGIRKLPPHPKLYFQVSKMLEDMNCSAAQVAGVIEQDPAMAAKTLQLVNSGYFSFGRTVTSIRRAVSLLGGYAVRSLVLGAELSQAFGGKRIPIRVMEALQQRSLLVGALGAELAVRNFNADEIFVTGVLHEVGKLVLWAEFPDQVARVERQAKRTGQPVYLVEREYMGVDHGRVGAYLLGLWGLPDQLVEAVAHHHTPWQVEQEGFDLLSVIYVSSCLAEEVAGQDRRVPLAEPVEEPYLGRLGVSSSLPEWRRTAQVLHERHEVSIRDQDGASQAWRRSA